MLHPARSRADPSKVQHYRRFMVVSSTASWVVLLLALGGGVWVHHTNEGDPYRTYPVYIHALLIYGVAAVICTLIFTIGAWNRRVMERMHALPLWASAALYLVLLTTNTGLVGNAGGVRGPFWLVLIPTTLMAGLRFPVAWATAFGIVADFCLFCSTLWSTQGHMTTVAWVGCIAVLPLFPLIGFGTALMATHVMEQADEAVGTVEIVTDHVQAVSDALSRAAEGSLGVTVPQPADPARQPSLAVLSSALSDTLADLRGLVGHVRGGGEQVGASAAELLATAEQHAASATQQSTAVTETTTTIEELAATAAQIAETAEAVARYAAETLRYAEQGQEAVNASVDAMDTIGGSVDAMARRALTLGERTHEIGRIVEVIDDLADQTNLLALNAAIEAARAGDHGRGFAVVATEIRKLAERAQSSTSQIRTIVGEVQAETHATIVASEEGAKEARVGAELARGVVHALERISGMVDETTTAAKEISIATQQQRSASEQVVAAMTQVSDVARQYAVGSQQTAASAAQLHGLAAGLRQVISRFSADEAPAGPPGALLEQRGGGVRPASAPAG